MTALEGVCDICGYSNIDASGRPTGEILGVASVPGFPVSLAWCIECISQLSDEVVDGKPVRINRTVIPTWCIESVICNPGDQNLEDTVKNVGIDVVLEHLAEWFLECETWVAPEPVMISGKTSDEHHYLKTEGPGRYMIIKDYLKGLAA